MASVRHAVATREAARSGHGRKTIACRNTSGDRKAAGSILTFLPKKRERLKDMKKQELT